MKEVWKEGMGDKGNNDGMEIENYIKETKWTKIVLKNVERNKIVGYDDVQLSKGKEGEWIEKRD